METDKQSPGDPDNLFTSAEWYDRSINWSARLARELPVLTDVFGPPGDGGILDAGCGTGHQAYALAQRGYRVVAADVSQEMLRVARTAAKPDSSNVEFVLASYESLRQCVGGGFDGLYCLGNSLAAAGSHDAVAEAVVQFGKCLRPGGRMFVQILNFLPMRSREPCVGPPRSVVVDGREYVSVRQFHFAEDHVLVTNVTLWHDDGWHRRAHSGRLYPVSLAELRGFCEDAGLGIDHLWGSYAREPLDLETSVDLLIAATRL